MWHGDGTHNLSFQYPLQHIHLRTPDHILPFLHKIELFYGAALTATYTFPVSSTGSTIDLGKEHNYRYVNAANVYAKGKADGDAISISSGTASGTGGSVSVPLETGFLTAYWHRDTDDYAYYFIYKNKTSVTVLANSGGDDHRFSHSSVTTNSLILDGVSGASAYYTVYYANVY